MKTSTRGIALIAKYEGLRLKAYKCPANVWTIGYGHTGNVKPTDVITKEKALSLLTQDLAKFEAAINSKVKVKLTQNQFDALVSFVYNVGIGAFSSSTLLKELNRGNYAAVPSQLKRWDKVNGKPLLGLTRRRNEEATLWETK